MTQVVVVGGGMGGMLAALRARQHGADVTLIEARSTLGGLASPLSAGGVMFDGGPYILLDRVRLAWALDQVGLDLGSIAMIELDPAYRVTLPSGRQVTVGSDLEQTAELFEQDQAGAGTAYRRYIGRATTALEQLAPMLVRPHQVQSAVTSGAWRAGLWAGLSLDQNLRRLGITGAMREAIRIWTYIAGGDPSHAPGPVALVPALIHRDGAARPVDGVHAVPSMVEAEVERVGVQVLRSTRVIKIEHDTRVRGVSFAASGASTGDGHIAADIVISDIGGAAALLDLVEAPVPPSLRLRMSGPLQSPGITAYLKTAGAPGAEINFKVHGEPRRATAFISPEPASGTVERPSRIITPMSHERAHALGADGQRRLLDELVAEAWWRDGVDSAEVVATRVVEDWGHEFLLRDDAMNLAMARRQVLLGRLPHRVDHIPGLFLAGSWTHPGQWISFCSVSGVLAADAAL